MTGTEPGVLRSGVAECEAGVGISSGMAQHIARVAARMFASRGYDATPVRAIVEAAGVTKPTLYYHFGSKEGLAQALLTVPMTRLVETMRGLVERPGDAAQIAIEMVEANLAFCREDADRARFVFALYFGPLGSQLSTELARFGEANNRLWERLGRRLADSGVIAIGRADAFASVLRGAVVIHTLDYLYRGGDLGPGLGTRLVRDVLRGFGERSSDRG